MLLKRADMAISTTDLQKKTRELLDRIAEGGQDHFVVMRDNRPAAVMMATGAAVGPGANPLGPSGGRKLVKGERAMRQRRSA